MRESIRRACNFRQNFYLIETSIDREEIFISVYTMRRARSSFIDLLDILLNIIVTSKEIRKTVIFIDSIREI